MEADFGFSTLKAWWSLPNDLLAIIAEFLSSDDIYKLWLTGNGALQLRLQANVRRIMLNPTYTTMIALWPAFLVHLRHLTSLYFDYTSFVPKFTVEKFPLEVLGRLESLERLWLDLPGYHWLTPYLGPVLESSSSTAPNLVSTSGQLIKHILPNLKLLSIFCHEGLTLDPEHWHAFPASLYTLELHTIQCSELPALATILPRLTRLLVKVQQTGVHWTLPPSLTDISIALFGETIVSMLSQRNLAIEAEENALNINSSSTRSSPSPNRITLPNLTSLYHQVNLAQPETMLSSLEDFQALEYLNLDFANTSPSDPILLEDLLQTYFKSLPNTLNRLWISYPLPQFSAQAAACLPRSLKDLFVVDGGDVSPANCAAFLRALPRNLERLRGRWRETRHLENSSWLTPVLQAMPKALTHSNILGTLPWTTDVPISAHLPNLKRFHLTQTGLTNLASLPSTLVYLTLKSENLADPNAIAQLLRPLKSLTHFERFNPRPIRVVSRHTLHATRSPSKVSPNPDKDPANPAFHDRQGQAWYWMQDLGQDFAYSPCRLDLVLPPSLTLLSLEVLETDWKSQTLQIQFDEEESHEISPTKLLESSPHSMMVDVDSSPLRKRDRNYFYQLRDLTIHIEGVSLKFGNRMWPETLTSLIITSRANAPYFGLKDLLTILPPNLQRLNIHIRAIEREDFLLLPKNIQTLSFSCFRLTAGSLPATVISLRDLPKSLTRLTLPKAMIEIEENPDESVFPLLPPHLTYLIFEGAYSMPEASPWSNLVSEHTIKRLLSSQNVTISRG